MNEVKGKYAVVTGAAGGIDPSIMMMENNSRVGRKNLFIVIGEALDRMRNGG